MQDQLHNCIMTSNHKATKQTKMAKQEKTRENKRKQDSALSPKDEATPQGKKAKTEADIHAILGETQAWTTLRV
eukprot:15354034-Ditylum_brightwellii.AAC.1